jgi:eukaryotic-like serine/threonine-protein kinase
MDRQSGSDPPTRTHVGDAFPTRATRPMSPETPPASSEVYSFLRPPEGSGEIGRIGNYRVLRLLGKGGMGLVFQAEDISLARPVALKVVRPEMDCPASEAAERFLREARAMAATKHDNVATVYQVGQDGDVVYLAMELLEGQTLDAWLERVGQPRVSNILRLGQQVARGLDTIHARGLVHRDIKPSNLWVESTTGRVKILDFGLARDTLQEIQLTRVGTLIGTPAYFSPEQARGKPLDGRSDLFSLGCVLYVLATGKLPFPAKNTLDQLAALAADQPAPIRELNSAIPDALADLIAELLAKDPDKRPPSAAVVAQRLQEIHRALPKAGTAVPVDATERLPVVLDEEPGRRDGNSFLSRRWRLLLAILALVGLAGIAAILLVMVLSGPGAPGGPGAPPPAEHVFLSDMRKIHVTNWPFHKTKDGKPPPKELFGSASVRGHLSAHGIIMHPAPPFDTPCTISFQLDKRYRTFTSRVSVNDSAPVAPSAMTFSVYGDGKLLWRCQPIIDQSQTEDCQVSVADVDVLKLEVTAADDVRRAHAVWIEPHVSK